MSLSTAAVNDQSYWTFAQLCAEVIKLTARPDRLINVQQAVIATTMKLHTMDLFYKDIVEAVAVFETAAFIQELDTGTLPRYRSLNHIRKWDPAYEQYQLTPSLLPPLYGFQNIDGIPTNPNLALKMLDIITPDNIFDMYRTERVDVAYVAGTSIKIKSSTSLTQALVGWYAYPVTGVSAATQYSTYSSWIATEFPWAIIYDAAGTELFSIGEADAASLYIRQPNPNTGDKGGLVWEHINNLISSNIEAEGR